jgi:hypothetical protein
VPITSPVLSCSRSRVTTMSRVSPCGGDDAVALADVVECGRDILVFVWVFVRKHQLCGWADGFGWIAVKSHEGRPPPWC